MALIVNKRPNEDEQNMSVTLKQRTWQTHDGRAVAEGDSEAAFLVGPEGAKVTDEQADRLGLVNGALPGKSSAEPKADEAEGDKAHHGEVHDKGADSKKKAASKKRASASGDD